MMPAPIDITQVLMWMIIAIGGALLSLIVWIWQRLQKKVDDLPAEIAKQVSKVHDQLVQEMQRMNSTHSDLEKDVRGQLSSLDRRLVRVQTLAEVQLNLPPTKEE